MLTRGRPVLYAEFARQLATGITREIVLPTRNQALGLVYRLRKDYQKSAQIRAVPGGHRVKVVNV